MRLGHSGKSSQICLFQQTVLTGLHSSRLANCKQKPCEMCRSGLFCPRPPTQRRSRTDERHRGLTQLPATFTFSPKTALRCITIGHMAAHFRGLCVQLFLHDFAGGWRCAPHVFCQMNNNFPIKQPNSTGSCSNCPFYPIALGSVHI